jgi:hypothetical protein
VGTAGAGAVGVGAPVLGTVGRGVPAGAVGATCRSVESPGCGAGSPGRGVGGAAAANVNRWLTVVRRLRHRFRPGPTVQGRAGVHRQHVGHGILGREQRQQSRDIDRRGAARG